MSTHIQPVEQNDDYIEYPTRSKKAEESNIEARPCHVTEGGQVVFGCLQSSALRDRQLHFKHFAGDGGAQLAGRFDLCQQYLTGEGVVEEW